MYKCTKYLNCFFSKNILNVQCAYYSKSFIVIMRKYTALKRRNVSHIWE